MTFRKKIINPKHYFRQLEKIKWMQITEHKYPLVWITEWRQSTDWLNKGFSFKYNRHLKTGVYNGWNVLLEHQDEDKRSNKSMYNMPIFHCYE